MSNSFWIIYYSVFSLLGIIAIYKHLKSIKKIEQNNHRKNE